MLRDGKLVDELWHKVVVGDVIKMENDQFVAVRLSYHYYYYCYYYYYYYYVHLMAFFPGQLG